MSERLKPDWSTAEVTDGTLTVGLSAKPPKNWRDAFERTATLLSAGTWDVTLHRKNASVQIASVRAGDEDRVRQLTEGAVLEANTKVAGEQNRSDAAPGDDDEHSAGADVPAPSADQQLANRFRAFAQEDEEADD
jgi:hypothetical protein